MVTPIPPRAIDNVPDTALETFNELIPAPEPIKLDADKVLLVLFHDKFADCKIDVAAFPINIWLAVNVVTPIPPREIDNVPDVILDAFIVDKLEFNAYTDKSGLFIIVLFQSLWKFVGLFEVILL